MNRTSWRRDATPYETYMAEQALPIHRGFGFGDVRELTMAPWRRLGCDGAFIELEGVGGLQSLHIMRIGPGTATEPEKHLFEEVVLVIEGSGQAEVWTDERGQADSFRWGPGSIFSFPLNAWHRVMASTDEAAVLLVASNAAAVMQMFRAHEEFIFDNPWTFVDRFSPGEGAFQPTSIRRHPKSGRGLYSGRLLPDALGLDLPQDGQRGEGYRHVELFIDGDFYTGFVGEYAAGSYARAHAHPAGPILACLRGAGYTLAWPRALGPTPWQDGHGEQVVRVEYRAGGVVSAAPGGGDWFHAHFPTSPDGMRVLAFSGGYPQRTTGAPGDVVVDVNEDLSQGGSTIARSEEDPAIGRLYAEALTSTLPG